MSDTEHIWMTERKRRRKAIKIDKTIPWTRDMILNLIAYVEKYPCIWDSRCGDYKDLTTRTSAWQKIEDLFDNAIPLIQLKKKWQLLCQTFSKNMTEYRQMELGHAEKGKITWEYWGVMSFMRLVKTDNQNFSFQNVMLEQYSHSVETEMKPLVDENETGISSLSSALHRSRRQTLPRKRFRPQTPADSIENISIHNPLENIPSISPRSLPRHDEFDDFGDYVALTLRQMQPDFAEKAMTELQYSLSLLSNEAAALRLRRSRLELAPIVRAANDEGVPKKYYLFGDREEPYDETIHQKMNVANENGRIIKDARLLSMIDRIRRVKPDIDMEINTNSMVDEQRPITPNSDALPRVRRRRGRTIMDW